MSSKIQNKQSTQLTSVTHEFSGPLPTPEDLARYEISMPGAAERIFAYAEKEQQHRHDIEASSVQTEKEKLNLAKAQIEVVRDSDRLGQIFGLIVCLACVAGAVVSVCMGYPWGATIGAVPLAAIIKAFRSGKSK